MTSSYLEKAIAIVKDHAQRLAADPDLARRLDAQLEAVPLRVPLDVPVVVLAKALASHGLHLQATDNGWLEVRPAELGRDEVLRLNRKNAADSMHFTPLDGRCWSCGADIVEQYGTVALASGHNVTGCRKCHRSFCD